MKTNRGISMRSQNGSNNIDFNLEPNTNAGMLFTRNVASGQAPVQVLSGTSGKQVYGFEAPYQKMFDVVDAISASGKGLPTENAVADAVNWIEVGRFTARQSGSGNKYDFIALKDAGYKYARVRENRVGGLCGADIDLSKVTISTQIKLIDKASFWSSSRIDITSITQHSADVTSADFIFNKVSITISGSSATYALKNSGQTETLIVEARK